MFHVGCILAVIACAISSTAGLGSDPEITRFGVSPGTVTEVRLPQPRLMRGVSWNYHIRLTSKNGAQPLLWFGYPIYLQSDNISTQEWGTCQIPQDIIAHRSYHTLEVAYSEAGFTAQLTNFMGNQTETLMLASYPKTMMFATLDECYQGEIQMYRTIETVPVPMGYKPPKTKKKCSKCSKHKYHGHAKDGETHGSKADHSHHHGPEGHSHGAPIQQNAPIAGVPSLGDDHDDHRPVRAEFKRMDGLGTYGPPTPITEPRTSWIPVIVIISMCVAGVIYLIAKSSKKSPKKKEEEEVMMEKEEKV